LTPDECKEKFPLIATHDLEGGIWVPHDGTISVADLLQTFVDECKKNDVPIIENCDVTKVITKPARGGHYSKVYAAETTDGVIECDYFVNCAGIVRFAIFCPYLI
jgi:glycine/D-amino acid oxidase-like deaminating enzyme